MEMDSDEDDRDPHSFEKSDRVTDSDTMSDFDLVFTDELNCLLFH